MAARFRDGAVVGLCLMAMVVVGSIGAEAQLSDKLTEDYYYESCPQIFDIVRAGVQKAVAEDPRNAASLIRLHFHDCFVDGCDGSILLNNVTGFESEQFALPNNDSIRQLNTIDDIKVQLEAACPKTVSCADIVALASRDAAIAVGLTYKYRVLFGRLDSFHSFFADASTFLPAPFFDFPTLVQSFKNKSLDEVDLVTLSGAHTVGRSHCRTLENQKIAGAPPSVGFNPDFHAKINKTCFSNSPELLVNLDHTTPDVFDNSYYKNLLAGDTLFVSDQTLFSTPGPNQALVLKYAADPYAFATQFALSSIRMGNISPKLGDEGEIRLKCSVPNSASPSSGSAASLIASQ